MGNSISVALINILKCRRFLNTLGLSLDVGDVVHISSDGACLLGPNTVTHEVSSPGGQTGEPV